MTSINLSETLNNCISVLNNYKNDIETHLTDEMKTKKIEKLSEIVKYLCKMDYSEMFCNELLLTIEDQFNNNDFNIDLLNKDDTFENYYKSIENIYDSKLKSKKNTMDYRNHDFWSNIFNNEEEIEEIVPQQASTHEDFVQIGNTSVMCSIVFKPPLDPIIKTIIRNPYKNLICGHIYECSSIKNYINTMKTKARCPYVGCSNDVQLSMNIITQDSECLNKIQEYFSNRESNNSYYNASSDDE